MIPEIKKKLDARNLNKKGWVCNKNGIPKKKNGFYQRYPWVRHGDEWYNEFRDVIFVIEKVKRRCFRLWSNNTVLWNFTELIGARCCANVIYNDMTKSDQGA